MHEIRRIIDFIKTWLPQRLLLKLYTFLYELDKLYIPSFSIIFFIQFKLYELNDAFSYKCYQIL
jgi:hypothetical protein